MREVVYGRSAEAQQLVIGVSFFVLGMILFCVGMYTVSLVCGLFSLIEFTQLPLSCGFLEWYVLFRLYTQMSKVDSHRSQQNDATAETSMRLPLLPVWLCILCFFCNEIAEHE
jgi:hypothetical protein